MEFIEKTAKFVKNIGGSIYSNTKDQTELVNLKVQKSVLENKLSDRYAQIGKAYVDYVQKGDADVAFNVSDILDSLAPDLEKLAELEAQIAEKVASIKAEDQNRILKKAKEEFDAVKEKLDKALDLEILSKAEYEEKMYQAQRKYDNYERIRKVEMQLDMGIITKEEYDAKMKEILE